ncbi:MAG: DUF3025 domain-containing protein [Burkholderiales bacterium]|nr:DUF3025 domain-containing protein [Burkholderiales bacterium]
MSRLSSLPWDPRFFVGSPLFLPLAASSGHFSSAAWPTRDELNQVVAHQALVSGGNRPLHLVPPHQPSRSAPHPGFEAKLFDSGALQFRPNNWHDFLNTLVWLTFPKAKAALNRRHYAAQPAQRQSRKRGAERDALTLFDESGIVVASSDASLLALLREFKWKDLFWRERNKVIACMRFYLFGHGLYEQALQPFIGMTGKAVLLTIDREFTCRPLAHQLAALDERLADDLSALGKLVHPRELSPLPVLGIPGWTANNSEESYYDNVDYFRPGRQHSAHGDSTKRA